MAKNIANKVARAEKDMTQKVLAEAVGVSRQTINAIEKGEYNPTIKLCRKMWFLDNGNKSTPDMTFLSHVRSVFLQHIDFWFLKILLFYSV